MSNKTEYAIPLDEGTTNSEIWDAKRKNEFLGHLILNSSSCFEISEDRKKVKMKSKYESDTT